MFRIASLLAAALMLTAAAQDEMVENPEYKAWSKLKPGAWVKWAVESHMGSMKMTQDMTVRLKEISADKAVVDQVVLMDMGGKKHEQTVSRTIPAKVAKGTNSDGAKVEEISKGEEELELKGAKVKCAWSEMKISGRTSGLLKVWKSDQVIGGVAKSAFRDSEAAKMTMTMTVVDWKATE